MRNASDKSCGENYSTYFTFNNFFKKKSCLASGNVEKYGRARQATDDNISQCMCSACWVAKATNTHSEYVILIAFPQQQWFHEHVIIRTLPLLFDMSSWYVGQKGQFLKSICPCFSIHTHWIAIRP
jgi:hypothetical protein